MTREEQIIQASEIFSTNDLLSFGGACEELDYGFREGAKWADEHPNLESLWHDVIEAPKLLNQWFLAQIGDNAFDTFVMEMDKNEDWKEWSNGINIKRWAYISDLLPKGSENKSKLIQYTIKWKIK